MFGRPALVAFFAVFVVHSPSWADEPDAETRAAAQSLFDEGTALLNKGDLENACPKFEKVVALTGRKAIGGLLQLAYCWEKQGKTASAWATFREAAGISETQNQPARAKEAEAKAAALFDQLPTIRLVFNDPIENISLSRDGSTWATAVAIEKTPIDPGKHLLEASAPGYNKWTIAVEVKPGRNHQDIHVTLQRTEGQLGPIPLAKDPVVLPILPATSPWSTPRILGIGGIGVGVAAGLTSLGIILSAKSDYDTILKRCDTTRMPPECSPGDTMLVGETRGRGDLATGIFVASALLTAGGIIAVIVAPSKAMQPGMAMTVRAGPGRFVLEQPW